MPRRWRWWWLVLVALAPFVLVALPSRPVSSQGTCWRLCADNIKRDGAGCCECPDGSRMRPGGGCSRADPGPGEKAEPDKTPDRVKKRSSSKRRPGKRTKARSRRCPRGEHRSGPRCCPNGTVWVPELRRCARIGGSPPPPASSGGADQVKAPGEWVLIRAGSFTMGSPANEPDRNDDERQHRVTITRDFWLQATEVTQGQWREVMGNNPSHFTSCGSRCPVEKVNWYEAVAYCNRLSKREGLPECYQLSGCKNTPGNDMECSSVSFRGLSCRGYRLPTEAEWEYAARAGTTTALYTGPIRILGRNNAPALDPIAWYGGNSGVSYPGGESCSGWGEVQHRSNRCGTHPVKGKRPNDWGLYDMLGNVWEWCHDWYDEYPRGSVTDPVGPTAGSVRVLRGGSWSFNARFARAAFRYGDWPADRYDYVGFRPVRSRP